MGKGMLPTGPDLSEVAQVRSPREVYWVIEHGIKFAGMPALGPTHTEEQMRDLTSFVMQLPNMSAEQYRALGAAAAPTDTVATSGEEDGHGHEGHTH